jgi:hypothetical protein
MRFRRLSRPHQSGRNRAPSPRSSLRDGQPRRPLWQSQPGRRRWHPADPPQGYHTLFQGQSQPALCRLRRGRSPRDAVWSGYTDGMPRNSQRADHPRSPRSSVPSRLPPRHRTSPGRWGAYRARIAVNSRTRSDSAGRNEDQPATRSALVAGRLCCVAGQGFEPWKASADGFTVRSRMHFRRSQRGV